MFTTFPFPSDSPPTSTSSSGSGWNPSFNSSFFFSSFSFFSFLFFLSYFFFPKTEKIFPIQRGQRAFTRVIEKRKVTFEIYHKRFSFLFFFFFSFSSSFFFFWFSYSNNACFRFLRSDVSVGKCELSLTPLLTQCECKVCCCLLLLVLLLLWLLFCFF